MNHQARSHLMTFLVALLVSPAGPSEAPPSHSALQVQATVTCPCELRGRSRCELESLFRQGTAVVPPLGAYRGDILLFTDFYRCPRLARRLSGLVWKGKHFEEGGTFINQFAGVKALRSCVGAGPSWLDGGPCVVLEYADGTPLFGSTRDEIRRVGPDIYVVLLFERTTGELRGILGLSPNLR